MGSRGNPWYMACQHYRCISFSKHDATWEEVTVTGTGEFMSLLFHPYMPPLCKNSKRIIH